MFILYDINESFLYLLELNLQTIKVHSCLIENHVPLLLREVLGELLDQGDLDLVRILGVTLLADRPVAAKHAAGWSELGCKVSCILLNRY